jgi:OOP family OmpA-OmpF porin
MAGAGVRIGLTPELLVRGDALLSRNRSKREAPQRTVNLTNFGVSLGLSYMLGSKPIPDSDGDGILENRDRCPDTPAGAQVDGTGCPSDSDADGVPDGVDRCAGTPAGTAVDATGCPALGGPWTLAAAEFEGAAALTSVGARATLDQVADLLRRRPGLRIEVRGYGPIVAAGQPGRRAPLDRAEMVKASLVGRGVAAARIRTIGFAGQEAPRVTIVVQAEGR